jgi:predicted nucleic acid-binding protein
VKRPGLRQQKSGLSVSVSNDRHLRHKRHRSVSSQRPSGESAQATKIVDESDDLLIPSVVLAEVAYVLTSFYRVPRARLVDQLIELVRKRNVNLMAIEKPVGVDALMMCRPSGRVSFVDALTWAHARSEGIEVIYAFDQRFPSDGVDLWAEMQLVEGSLR